MKKAVLVAPDTPVFQARLAELNAIAARAGGAVEFVRVDPRRPLDELAKDCTGAIALTPGTLGLISRAQYTELVRRVPTIKLVQTPSAGTDSFDKPALAAIGVDVANNGGANAVAVAEHTVALVVGLYRKLDLQLQSARSGRWQADVVRFAEEEFHTLVGKRVGIVGLGRIGSRVAKRLRGWECEVVYHDILDFSADYEQAAGATRVGFDALLASCDVVSLHVPLEPNTRGMMSDSQFARMKPTALLVNTCRGPVVDEAALVRALRAGRIFGAGLDVIETEPMPADNPLLGMPNVLITPHLATRAIESSINAKNFVVENITRLARGEPIQSVVDPVQE